MNPKDILDNLDSETIEDIELSEINISEIEIKRTKKNVKNKLKKRGNIKRKIVASAVVVILVGVISTPAVASNIPVLNNIYKQLGLFKGYEKYTNYIGQSKESNGYKVTIENIISIPNKLQAVVKIESKEPLKKKAKQDNFMLRVNMDKRKAGISSSSSEDSYYLNDYTMVLNYKEDLNGDTYPKQGDLTLNIQKLSEDFKEVELDLNFDAKVDFSSAFKDKYNIVINKSINDKTKIKSLESNAMGSELTFSGEDIKYIYDSWGPKYYIEVDGKIYTRTYGDNMDFPELTADVVREAKSINVILSDTKESLEWTGNDDTVKIESGQKGNIKYPKIIKSQNGLKGEFYKIEWQGDKLEFYFKSEYAPLAIFDSLALSTYDNEGEQNFNRYCNSYTISKVDDGYVAIFDGVDKKKNIELNYGDHGLPLDNYKNSQIIKIK
ncbi:DUF4179 domain-containing protein [Clostridium sardiniense]|uniref:DUF4179 domain-containing protein n=1 Tax=Clostridium sardiniense TaxID=29369 RepID=UPI003D34966C